MGSLGLLLGAGAAWGNQQMDTTGSGSDTSSAQSTSGSRGASSQVSGKPECRDAGVTIAFKTGSAELDQNARGALDGVATWMKADENRTMHLEGFADTTGDSEANLVLSAHRAEAVKSYLIDHGVSSSKVMTVGRGEEVDHLPANGRAVTFMACQPASVSNAVAENEKQAEQEPANAETNPSTVIVVPPPAPAPAPAPVTTVPPAAPKPYWARGFGFALMAGGAYQDFTNNNMRSTTTGGGGWSARFIGGTNSIIGFEAAYIGAAQEFNGLGITNNTPLLVQNGLEGNARLNVPIRYGAHLFEPYGYAGLGYSHYTVSNYNENAQRLSSFTSSDDVMNFPVGGGFAYAYKAFIIDARAGWTGTYYQNLLTGADSTGTLDHWNVGGQVGFTF
jgi:outer membrane protein OmpA-like peptidoglycan-associated protein